MIKANQSVGLILEINALYIGDSAGLKGAGIFYQPIPALIAQYGERTARK